MKKIAGSVPISQRHRSADPDGSTPKFHGSATLTEKPGIKETCLTWWLERAMLLRLSIASDME